MNIRKWVPASLPVALVIGAALFAPAFSAAQAAPPTLPPVPKAVPIEPDKNWKVPRTPDGQPDLQGYWTSLTFTPMERPAKFAGREFLTDQEIKDIYMAGVKRSQDITFANPADTPVYDSTVYGLAEWQNGVRPNRRTSVVIDPPDGRIPPLTPAAQKAKATEKKEFDQEYFTVESAQHIVADGPEALGQGVRCINFGRPPITPGGGYDNTYQIVQSPGYVLIEYEWDSEIRIIPLDGSPHLSSDIHNWHGDSRGHWEGNTLVVETVNFRPDATYDHANPKTLKITERFTRLDNDAIEYRFTIDDPNTWTKPWTGVFPITHVDGPMFEYACSEGNNGAINILAGVRAEEKAESDKQKGVPISQK